MSSTACQVMRVCDPFLWVWLRNIQMSRGREIWQINIFFKWTVGLIWSKMHITKWTFIKSKDISSGIAHFWHCSQDHRSGLHVKLTWSGLVANQIALPLHWDLSEWGVTAPGKLSHLPWSPSPTTRIVQRLWDSSPSSFLTAKVSSSTIYQIHFVCVSVCLHFWNSSFKRFIKPIRAQFETN